MKTIVFTLIGFGLAFNALPQVVQGTVYDQGNDSNHTPLPGVNVYWLGTNMGTQTDADGAFSIKRKEGSNKLVFSYIGYTADTLENPQANVRVLLKAGTRLNEVVVKSENSAYYSKLSTVQVQNITSSELRKAACCNLSESFTTNASVDVNYTDAVSGAKQIELLGLAGKYSQIMVEKMPQVRGISSNYGLGYIPGSWMESIQVSKGTSSVVDGFESTTGQINVEFKKPFKGEKFMLNVYGNQNERLEANANARFKLNKNVTTAVLVHGENFTRTHDDNHDGFVDMPAVQQYNVMNRWKLQTPSGNVQEQIGIKAMEEHRFGGQNGFDGHKSSINDSSYSILVNTSRQEAFSKTGFIFGKPGTSLGFINNVSHIDQQSVYGHNTYDARQNSLYSNLIFESIINNTAHKYTAGVSFVYDDLNEVLNSNTSVKKESTPGAFFQYTYTYLDKFTAMGGIRADYSNIYGMFYTPRVHFKYNFPSDATLRISAGKGYRSPNALSENANLLASSRQIIVADNIKMENAWNYGITASKTIKLLDNSYTIYGEYFRTDFINQLVTDLEVNRNYAFVSNQHGTSFSNNYQAEISTSPSKHLDVLVAFRVSDAKAHYNGTLKSRPLANKYKALATATYYTNLKKWQFDLTAQLNGGGRLPDTYTSPGNSSAGGSFPAYTIINSQVSKNFKRWNVYVGVENILDFKQEHPIVDAANPFGDKFDASTIWGPVEGRMLYAGARLVLGEFFE